VGSVVAAFAHSIYGLMIGRALQGGGAIGSTVLATVADLTRDENRGKAMGMMGMAIGASFAIAMVLGPLVNAWGGLTAIFWVNASLAIIAGLLVWLVVPKISVFVSENLNEVKPTQFHKILKNRNLLRLDASIFILHAILTSVFIAIPIILTDLLHLSSMAQVILYLVVLVLSFFAMFPLIIFSEKKRQVKAVFMGAIFALLITLSLLGTAYTQVGFLAVLLLIFFTAFSLLEATLPAWISKITPILSKGTAMGVYSSSQFLGIFFGGSLGGLVLTHFGIAGIFAMGASLALIWLLLAYSLPQPPYLSTMTLNRHQFFEQDNHVLTQQLAGVAGIIEVAIPKEEGLVCLKIDRSIVSQSELRQTLENSKLVGTCS